MLAIDDEEDALTLLRAVLEAAGAEVTTLGSPLDGAGAHREVKPDVLVVDLGMPEMDGFELITRIRKSTDPTIRDHAGRGPDGFRAIGGPHQGASQRLRNAPRQAGRSRRAGRVGGDVSSQAHQHGNVAASRQLDVHRSDTDAYQRTRRHTVPK